MYSATGPPVIRSGFAAPQPQMYAQPEYPAFHPPPQQQQQQQQQQQMYGVQQQQRVDNNFSAYTGDNNFGFGGFQPPQQQPRSFGHHAPPPQPPTQTGWGDYQFMHQPDPSQAFFAQPPMHEMPAPQQVVWGQSMGGGGHQTQQGGQANQQQVPQYNFY